MAEPEVTIRVAAAGDARGMAHIDSQSWPPAMATSAAEFLARIRAYPKGQLVAESKSQIVGAASAQRITEAFLEANDHRYDLVTDGNRFTNSHHPTGEIYQLIGVSVLPELRGRRLGRELVNRQIEFARSLSEVRRIIGFTRPREYHRHRKISIEQYVHACDSDGKLLDPVLAFHVDAGARIISLHADFRPNDHEACGYGVLFEYPFP